MVTAATVVSFDFLGGDLSRLGLVDVDFNVGDVLVVLGGLALPKRLSLTVVGDDMRVSTFENGRKVCPYTGMGRASAPKITVNIITLNSKNCVKFALVGHSLFYY